MQMTKKIVSIVLAVMIVASMMVVGVVSASALDETNASVKYTKTNGNVVYGESFWDCSTTISNGTYEVLKDFTETSRWPTGVFGATATIDLGGHTVTFTNPDSVSMNIRGGSVTVKNGTIIFETGAANGQGFQLSKGTLNIESNATLKGTGTTSPVTVLTGTLNTKGKLYAENTFAIATNGSSSKNYTINVTGGTVSSDNASAIYQCGQGTLNISGGTITGTTGVYVKSGDTNITGGTIKGTGTKADYDFNGNGANATGDALVVDSCGYPGGAPEVNVNGGTFQSTNADAIASYKKSDDAEYSTDTTTAVTGFVKQATVKSNVKANLYDDDLYVIDTENNTATPKTLTDEISWEWVASDNVSYQYKAKMTVTVGDEEYYTTTVSPTIKVVNGELIYTATAKYAGVTYTAPEKNVGSVVKSSAELNKAAAAGGEWSLGKDISNVSSVTVPNGFKLNGNGYTIYANTNVLPQYYMFVCKDANTKFEINNVTLDGGNGRYGAIQAYTGNGGNNPGNVITLNNVTIQNFNNKANYAGAVYAFGSSTVNLNDCTIVGNKVTAKTASEKANTGAAVWAGASAKVNINGGTYDEILLHGGTANTEIDGDATVDTLRFGYTNSTEDSSKMKAVINDATVNALENYTEFYEENVVKDPNLSNVAAPAGYEWDDSATQGMMTLVSLNPLNPLMVAADSVADGNAFGLNCKYLKGTILGVQKKNKASVDAPETSESGQETTHDARFVAVLDSNVLAGAEDYGFVLAKVSDSKTYTNTKFDNLKAFWGNGEKTISAKDTKNNVCGDEAYGDPESNTAYKYVTCAVNGIEDDGTKVVARFYVKTGGKTYYAKYAGENYHYTGCMVPYSTVA